MTGKDPVIKRVMELVDAHREEYGNVPDARVVSQLAIQVMLGDGWVRPAPAEDPIVVDDTEPSRPRRVRVVGPAALVDPAVLSEFGWLVVKRYTEPDGDRLRAEIPCCTKGIDPEPARPVLLRMDLPEQRVVCPSCRLLWLVELEEDIDSGHLALFQLVSPVILASHRRTYRRPL